jgi:hypothetical protein
VYLSLYLTLFLIPINLSQCVSFSLSNSLYQPYQSLSMCNFRSALLSFSPLLISLNVYLSLYLTLFLSPINLSQCVSFSLSYSLLSPINLSQCVSFSVSYSLSQPINLSQCVSFSVFFSLSQPINLSQCVSFSVSYSLSQPINLLQCVYLGEILQDIK